MLLNDIQIEQLVDEQGLIENFSRDLVEEADGRKIISYGLNSCGYDLRLGKDIKIFKHHSYPQVIDPKAFDSGELYAPELMVEEKGDKYVIIPPKAYALGVVVERLNIPRNISVLFVTKSTYAKAGLMVTISGAQPGWRGYLTVELFNATSSNMAVYIGEGITQALFFQLEECCVSYDDRKGKYQDQLNKVTLAS